MTLLIETYLAIGIGIALWTDSKWDEKVRPLRDYPEWVRQATLTIVVFIWLPMLIGIAWENRKD